MAAISSKKIDVQPLISEIVELADFNKIYGNMAGSRAIASILKYSDAPNAATTVL